MTTMRPHLHVECVCHTIGGKTYVIDPSRINSPTSFVRSVSKSLTLVASLVAGPSARLYFLFYMHVHWSSLVEE
jgi:hypothetical protein